jgi:hypothetical protein
MPAFLSALGLLAGIGLLSVLLPEWLNRDLNRVAAAARRRVQDRLTERTIVSLEAISRECGISEPTVPGARKLLRALGKALGLEPGLLRPTDRLADLSRVILEELDTVTTAEWARARLAESVDVFSYELVHQVTAVCDFREWRPEDFGLVHVPKDDDEWADLIGGMTVRKLLHLFAPLVQVD